MDHLLAKNQYIAVESIMDMDDQEKELVAKPVNNFELSSNKIQLCTQVKNFFIKKLEYLKDNFFYG